MEIIHNSGVTIRIEEAWMRHTYLGLFTGTKLRASQAILEDLSRAGIPERWRGMPIKELCVSKHEHGITVPLPDYMCIAIAVEMRSSHLDSLLVVVWFQDKLLQEIPEPVTEELKSIDWRQLSRSYDYYS